MMCGAPERIRSTLGFAMKKTTSVADAAVMALAARRKHSQPGQKMLERSDLHQRDRSGELSGRGS